MRISLSLNDIPMREVLRYLGMRTLPNDPLLLGQIDRAFSDTRRNVRPVMLIQRFSLNDRRTLEGTSITFSGESIARHLSGCPDVLLMAATLGIDSERLLLRTQVSDPAQSLVLDAVLSAAIESVCDQLEFHVRPHLLAADETLTDRFSPGYGDLPMFHTADICCALNAPHEIGLTVSSSGLMIPRKSVCAIIGVGRSIPVKHRRCVSCRLRVKCPYQELCRCAVSEE